MNLSPTDTLQFAWGLWFASWLVAALWSSRPERRQPSRDERLYRVVTALGALVLFWLHPRSRAVDAELWQPGRETAWALVFVAICGFALTWWARVTLGQLWSSGVARKADHAVVMTGPYRFVRHPIYSGILLAVLATAVMRGTALGWLGAGLIAVGLFIKARMEEAFLRSELGDEQYLAYAHRVPMLVPFLSPRPMHQ